MAIEITPEVRALVQGIYASGQFASESEVVSAAVRLLHDRQQLIAKLEQGRRELDQGNRLSAAEVFADLHLLAQELDNSQL
ncbi:MAG: type II toxin-antitoxin system ParD family antitoxin [Pirellulales bacterium]